MITIIEKIAQDKRVTFSQNEMTWFNGEANFPLKYYQLEWNFGAWTIKLNGEYRRNTWQKPNWHKALDRTDIYLWTCFAQSQKREALDFEISKATWLDKILRGKGKLIFEGKNKALLNELVTNEAVNRFYFKSNDTVRCQLIGISDQGSIIISTHLNSLFNHEIVANNLVACVEQVTRVIDNHLQ